ncbi:MAG: hypothetical protein CL681_26160 [Blastopirellula sp.]|nr:hypothetical protein [Blastopirellula sp.]
MKNSLGNVRCKKMDSNPDIILDARSHATERQKKFSAIPAELGCDGGVAGPGGPLGVPLAPF